MIETILLLLVGLILLVLVCGVSILVLEDVIEAIFRIKKRLKGE